ncbi:S49 family peptidase [Alcaligenes endophyticus]|uniref:S49 family peptidase n=1 Tax=Alcaligenes endophyticus TaxID=1929088 RepID=A0ABT8EKA2_9BURK|nr:S49 family peptidase [Alcaligenes endophyticus]MCX5592032.1 S49 family peptidase [Alcaligenes endophyticus]MDN4121722.1 S49 family peptidase [Alcaligenes endophyticus]
MKNHHRLISLIFNTPQLIREDVLDMAVHWANQAMNLNIINVHGATAQHEGAETQAVSPSEQRLQAAQDTGVYVLPVHGVLVSRNTHLDPCYSMTSYEEIRGMLNVALNDPSVEHIVLDIDSPGGSTQGCFELVDDIYGTRAIKPITAISNFGAYSAGFAIASAATNLIVSRSSGVGSVGVIARHIDLSKRHEQQGIKITSIFAGARKDDLATHSPLTEEAGQWLSDLVNSHYETFTETVARNRGMSVSSVKATEAGVFFGAKAVELGFADSVESPQIAVNRIAAEVAKKRASTPKKSSVATRAAAIEIQNRI